MKSIAENELDDIQMSDSLKKQLSGPLVSDKGIYVEYKWYKNLEWGDTAAVYIDVYKQPSSFSLRDNFFWPRTTMNYQWYYFLFPNGTSKFANILPSQSERVDVNSPKVKLYKTKNTITDSINLIIRTDRLFYFLQKGYFTVVEKNEDFTVVDFYEPIANIVHKDTRDTMSTMSAKVSINDSLGVIIMPYDVPIEIRNKK